MNIGKLFNNNNYLHSKQYFSSNYQRLYPFKSISYCLNNENTFIDRIDND